MTLIISAKRYHDGTWHGFVLDGDEELHMTPRSYDRMRDAHFAANEWRKTEEAYRARTHHGERVERTEPYWNGYEQVCPCGREIEGSRGGVLICERGHLWRRVDETWEQIDA